MLYFTLFFACNDAPEPSGKDVVLNVQKHASPKADDFQTKSFECCDTKEARDLLDQYLALTRAMAADNDAKTKAAVDSLVTYTSTPDFESYAAAEGLQEWIAGPKYWSTLSRKDIQDDFEAASQIMVDFAKKHKTTKSESTLNVITAFCPMAPGRWLQTESTISNPYYGSAMLTCGVFE
jgi:hypothetical protein